jgi:DNA-binding transcriptional LysR family regulator
VTIQQLLYFRCLADSLSFTKAAKECFVSQTAISRQIAQLEKELHVQLLERDTAHVRLTPAGQYFFEACEALLNELNTTVARTREIAHTQTSHLTVGIPTILEQHAIAGRLKAFHAACPNVAIRTVSGSRQELVTALVKGQINLLVALAFDLPDLVHFQVCSLAREASTWLLPASHPLAGQAAVAPAQLADEKIVLTAESSTAPTLKHIEHYLRRLGLDGSEHLLTRDLSEAFLLVSAGLGIALVPSGASQWLPPDLVCVPIDGPQWEMEYLLLTIKGQNPNADAFLALGGAQTPQ